MLPMDRGTRHGKFSKILIILCMIDNRVLLPALFILQCYGNDSRNACVALAAGPLTNLAQIFRTIDKNALMSGMNTLAESWEFAFCSAKLLDLLAVLIEVCQNVPTKLGFPSTGNGLSPPPSWSKTPKTEAPPEPRKTYTPKLLNSKPQPQFHFTPNLLTNLQTD